MLERGWTASESELFEGRLFDAVFVASEDGMEADIAGFTRQSGRTVRDADAAVQALEARGLVSIERVIGGGPSAGGVELTGQGRLAAQRRRGRRSEARARAVASREALLDWLYAQKRAGVHSPILTNVQADPQGWFEGSQFTEEEIGEAGTHLKSLGLINGVSAWGTGVLRGEIEPSGEVVVEQFDSSLSAWTAGHRGGQQIVTNFNGPVSGQVGIGQVSQTQNVGMDAGALLALLADVREAAVALEPGEQVYAGTYVDVIQAEASAESPSPEVIKTSGERLKGIAGKAGNAGFTAAVSALVNGLTKAYFGT